MGVLTVLLERADHLKDKDGFGTFVASSLRLPQLVSWQRRTNSSTRDLVIIMFYAESLLTVNALFLPPHSLQAKATLTFHSILSRYVMSATD